MSNLVLLDEILYSKYSCKTNEKTLKQYFTFEYYFLSNNISLNPHKFNKTSKIELTSLESYFPYPMILTRCFFKALDIQQKNYLNIDDYTNGLITLYNGQIEERLKLIFRIFNINNDRFMHIEDVKCILNYCHVFYNKANKEVLDETIRSFFGKHKVFTQEDFINRSIHKSPGLFFIILSILMDNKTFTQEVLTFMEDSEKYNELGLNNNNNNNNNNHTNNHSANNNGNSNANLNYADNYATTPTIKKTPSKFKTNYTRILTNIPIAKKDVKLGISTICNPNCVLSKSNTNCPVHNPKSLGIETNVHTGTTSMLNEDIRKYLAENFQIEINNIDISSVNVHSQTSQNENSFDYSEECDVSGISDVDLEYLNQFELDMDEIKNDLLEQHFIMTEFAVPKGSNDFDMKSGVIQSKAFKAKDSLSSTKSFNFIQFNQRKRNDGGGGGTPKVSGRGSSFGKETKNHSTKALLTIDKNSNKFASNNSFSSYVNTHNQAIGNCQSDIHNLSTSNIMAEHFEEDIFMLKKNNKTKKYTLVLIKGYVFLLKKRTNNNNLFGQKEETNDYNVLGAKMCIPTKKLFVSGIDYHYIVGEREFIQLTLISTVLFRRRTYHFLFDSKLTINTFIKIFCSFTNYTNIETDYCYVKDVGKGSFCQMKLMRHIQSNSLYAVKKIKKDFHSIEEFTTLNWEKDIITFLKNFPKTEHILKCYDIIETAENIYIVTEYIAGGSLSSFIRKNKICLPSTTVKKIIYQVVKGLSELHSYGIVHRDMKLENILMDYKDVTTFTAKVIDFGLSQVITPLSKTKETYGTLIYCSPEILLNVPYNYKVDVWSLGIIAYYLEYTFMPFNVRGRENEQDISNKIIANELKFPKKVDSTNNPEEIQANKMIMTMIRQCLTKDINQRPTSEQLIFYLSK